ncbi:MAG TPA: M50 family metallopeptidase [Candidatus Paceibacterota bacterium]|nr:M50 family metallopeptidase [Candidatus Paceibacterota bacterium]
MLIAILVIIGLSLLILGHEAGHFFVAKALGMKVDEFGFGFPPRIFAIKKGETEYSFNWLPFGGFVRIAGERGEFAMQDELKKDAAEAPTDAAVSTMNDEERKRTFFAQPAWKKSLVILAGVFMNFILGWLFVSAVLMIGAPQTLVITGTEPNSPAAQAGIAGGDVIMNFKDTQSFISYVNEHQGQKITLPILHNGKEVDVTLTPRVNPPANEGSLGVLLEQGGTTRENPLNALYDGLLDSAIIFWLTLQAFGQLVSQLFIHATIPAGVVGPVGIFGVAEETGKIGLTYLLQLIGVISINLSIVNLLPFPALDGGRFVMIIIEKIKGSAIPEKVESYVNGIGFAILITLMILVTIRDVWGLF